MGFQQTALCLNFVVHIDGASSRSDGPISLTRFFLIDFMRLRAIPSGAIEMSYSTQLFKLVTMHCACITDISKMATLLHKQNLYIYHSQPSFYSNYTYARKWNAYLFSVLANEVT